MQKNCKHAAEGALQSKTASAELSLLAKDLRQQVMQFKLRDA